MTLSDEVRLAASAIPMGVVAGALAGGIESRNVIRHSALFRDELWRSRGSL